MGSFVNKPFVAKRWFRFGICLTVISVFIFYVIGAMGCIGIPSLYLVAIESTNGTNQTQQVRVGYFGLCFCSDGTCSCEATIGRSETDITNSNSSSQLGKLPDSAGELVSVGLSLQSHFFMMIVAASGLLFLIGVLFGITTFLFSTKKKPSKRPRARPLIMLKRLALSNLWISVALAFTSAVSATQLGPALQFISGDLSDIAFSSDLTLAGLHWLAFAFSMLLSIIVSVLFIKIDDAHSGGLDAVGGEKLGSSYDDGILDPMPRPPSGSQYSFPHTSQGYTAYA